MCGICGFLGTRVADDAPAVLQRMLQSLAHRGPDGNACFTEGGVGLGHARLSIIDLQGGQQPLFNEDRSLVLVCNGEIYNHQKLRAELSERGHVFSSHSDSEVILHLWEELGEDCVHELRGMFAFALYDCKRQEVFLARDRFGQKPLYFHHSQLGLIFSSEIKGVLAHPGVPRELDVSALDGFLFYQYVPGARTLFRDIHALPPGCCARVSGSRCEIRHYWQPLQRSPLEEIGDPVESTEAAVLDAVASHLVSDVPVGVFLSGGIDSSLVAAMAASFSAVQMDSFSIGFDDERYDETPYALAAAANAGTHHQVFRFDATTVRDGMYELATLMDQPLADDAALPLLFLSRQTAASIKVVLTGDGGDELFAGYGKYRGLAGRGRPLWQRWVRDNLLDPRGLAECQPDPFSLHRLRSRLGLKIFPELAACYYKHFWEGWDRYALYSHGLRQAVAADQMVFPQSPPRGLDTALQAMSWWDQSGYLPGALLLKTDMTTMSASLEARAPLLDHHLAAHAAALRESDKVSGGQTKLVLRSVSERWLPENLVQRPKRGFGLPLKRWLQHDLASWVSDLLLRDSVTVPRYFNTDAVRTLLHQHQAGYRNHTGRIYTLLIFELWHRHYMS